MWRHFDKKSHVNMKVYIYMHTMDNVFFYNMLCFGFVLNVFLCFVHLSQNAVLHFPLKMDLSKSEKAFFFPVLTSFPSLRERTIPVPTPSIFIY